MKYEELTHEERELVLFIENTEYVYKRVIPNPNSGIVHWAGEQYKKEYANDKDKIFTMDNHRNVTKYLKTRKD